MNENIEVILESIGMALFGVFKLAFTVWLAWMGFLMYKEIRKAWEMDHKHDRNASKEEYFQHIKDVHPDIWEETMNGDEARANTFNEGVKRMALRLFEEKGIKPECERCFIVTDPECPDFPHICAKEEKEDPFEGGGGIEG